MENLVPIGIGEFYGGQSIDQQLGSKGQYWYGRHIDHRKNPTQFTVLPGTAPTTSGVVTDLVLDMAVVPSGAKFAVGDTGNIYRITSAGVWSKFGALSEASGAGLLYRPDVDMAYISGQTGIARIKTIATTPLLDANFFQRGRSTASTCYKTGGINTYVPVGTINETAVNMRTFIMDIEPLYSIKIKVLTKGIGDWTLTLHDDANNSLGTVTVTNANLTNSALNEFVFSTPVRLQISNNNYTSVSSGGRTYHFHITSTAADGTLATTTASSLADCDMEPWANALVTTRNTYHPIYQFANMTLIGNERYVASYEPLQDQPTTADFLRHRLTFPPGYEVCGYAQLDLYVAIAAEKRSSSGSFQEGKIFLWDGIQTTYNRYWDVPEGSPESLSGEKNIITYISGGDLYRSAGSQPIKVRHFRNTDSEFSGVSDTTHAPVHGMTVRRGVLLIGYPFSTTNQSLEHGVYSFGHVSSQYPESWGFSYTMSSGSVLNNGSNNLRIGMVKNFSDTLYISWRDDSQSSKYGVDIVNNSSAPAPDFDFQDLIRFPTPWKQKELHKVLAVFNALPSDCSVRVKYKLDGEASWHYGEYVTNGATFAVMNVPNGRCSSFEVGCEGTVGTTTPAIAWVGGLVDGLKEERELG